MRQAAMLERPIWKETEGILQPIANEEPKTSVKQPLNNNWILPETCVSLEADPSPVRPLGETPASAGKSTTAF